MHCWQLRGQEQAAPSDGRSGVERPGMPLTWQWPKLWWGCWILLNSSHFLSSLHHPSPLQSVWKILSTWPSLIAQPPFVRRNELFTSFLRSIFNPIGPVFSLYVFLSFQMVCLFWLMSKQRNIFTISRNSIWAPASINFSTTAKCPSKHALWRAVRLYCQRLKQEIVVCIKMHIIL